MSPSTGTSFPVIPNMHTLLFRLLLASASVVAYALLVQLTPFLEALDDVPYVSTAFHLLVGAIFGALVMAPYARVPHRILRGVALAATSAAMRRSTDWPRWSPTITRSGRATRRRAADARRRIGMEPADGVELSHP